MSVDFTNVNSSLIRHYTTASTAVHVSAGEDFTCIASVYLESGGTGEHWVVLSAGTLGTAGSVAMYKSKPYNNRPSSWLGEGASLAATNAYINDTPVLDILYRRDGILTRGHIALGSTQLFKATQSNSQAINAGGNLFIGARSDLDDTREWHGRISDIVFTRGYGATDDELIAIANGKPLEDCRNLWRKRQFQAHLKTAKVPQLVDLTGNFVLTRHNTGYGKKEDDPKLFVRNSAKLKIQPLISAFAAQQSVPGRSLQVSTQEPGSDAAALSGKVSTLAALATGEPGGDVSSLSASLAAAAQLTTQETGGDAAAFSATTAASAQLTAQEFGGDIAALSSRVVASAALAVNEHGSDAGLLCVSPLISVVLTSEDQGGDTAAFNVIHGAIVYNLQAKRAILAAKR